MTFETEIERLRKQNRKLKVTIFVFTIIMIAGGAISSLFAAHQMQRARSAMVEAQKALVESQDARKEAEAARHMAEEQRTLTEAKALRNEAERRNTAP